MQTPFHLATATISSGPGRPWLKIPPGLLLLPTQMRILGCQVSLCYKHTQLLGSLNSRVDDEYTQLLGPVAQRPSQEGRRPTLEESHGQGPRNLKCKQEGLSMIRSAQQWDMELSQNTGSPKVLHTSPPSTLWDM